jgi:hypothetical protein
VSALSKICSKCGEEKPLLEFHKALDCKFGVRAHCKVCARRDANNYHHNNRDRVTARMRARRLESPEQSRAYFRAWQHANKSKRAAYKRAWIERYPERYRASVRASHERRKAVPQHRLEAAIRSGVHKRLKGQRPSRRTFDMLGYAVEELMAHLERQFLPKMTWANFGEWHIDHIVPLSSFDYETPDDPDFRRAWALPNLRPMWGRDNIAKGAKRLTLL